MPQRIIFIASDTGAAKIRADAAKLNLTLTEYISKRLGVKPLPMGRPAKTKENKS